MTTLRQHVERTAKAAPKAQLAQTLGALVKARLALRARAAKVVVQLTPAQQRAAGAPFHDPLAPQLASKPRASRRSTRRLGKFQRYTVTGKANTTRWNTWTHYMIDTICAHTDTWDANAAHSASGEYPGKRLDFHWAADQGYITF